MSRGFNVAPREFPGGDELERAAGQRRRFWGGEMAAREGGYWVNVLSFLSVIVGLRSARFFVLLTVFP